MTDLYLVEYQGATSLIRVKRQESWIIQSLHWDLKTFLERRQLETTDEELAFMCWLTRFRSTQSDDWTWTLDRRQSNMKCIQISYQVHLPGRNYS